MLVLQDPDTSLRLLVIEVVFENNKYFSATTLGTDFIPLLLREMSRSSAEPGGWVLDHFTHIVTFILERKLLDEASTEVLRQYFQVIGQSEEFVARLGIHRPSGEVDGGEVDSCNSGGLLDERG